VCPAAVDDEYDNCDEHVVEGLDDQQQHYSYEH
jgi:hypothetical protein